MHAIWSHFLSRGHYKSVRWESQVPLGKVGTYNPTCIIQPTKTTRNFSVFCLSKKPTTTFHSRINFLKFLFFRFLFSKFTLFQVSNAAQGTARSYIYLIYLFPLSRILRSLPQSIRTIFHSTRQTLKSISYCFGTCGIYSTFYISIDFFVFYFFLFSWGC